MECARCEFGIGGTFWCGSQQWRSTNVGTRTIIAIHIDSVDVKGISSGLRHTRSQAEADGWFKRPPYAVDEVVFDEDNMRGCSLERNPIDPAPPA